MINITLHVNRLHGVPWVVDAAHGNQDANLGKLHDQDIDLTALSERLRFEVPRLLGLAIGKVVLKIVAFEFPVSEVRLTRIISPAPR